MKSQSNSKLVGEVEGYYDLEDMPLRLEDSRRIQLMEQMASLGEFEVKGSELTSQETELLRAVVEHGRGKKDIVGFLREHPHILAWYSDEGNSRWCIAESGIDCEYAPDFLLAELGQMGLDWCGFELQSPHAKLFRKDGNPSSALRDAVQRVADWRVWLKNNIEYARQPHDKGGLNLIDIRADIPHYIFIGRRRDMNDSNQENRRRMSKGLNLEIHTYDWLIEAVERGQKNSD